MEIDDTELSEVSGFDSDSEVRWCKEFIWFRATMKGVGGVYDIIFLRPFFIADLQVESV